MTKLADRGRWPVALAAGGVLFLLALAGCRAGEGHVSILSFADPFFPETIQVPMATAVYRADAGGDIHLVCHSAPRKAEEPETIGWLHAHIYWRPKAGKTHDDPTATDATLRYVVLSAQGARLYSGSGFVYPEIDRVTGALTAKFEDARLQPIESEGQPPESLGDARLSGVIRARRDAPATIDLISEMNRIDLEAGSRR